MNRLSAFKAVIGPSNQNYYLSYFKRCEDRGYAPVSWNWPVLFLGIFWLLWRRQYRWALFTMALGIGSSMVSQAVTAQTGSPETGMFAAYLLGLPYLGIYLPLKANGIYYDWCCKMIDTAGQHLPGQHDQQKDWLMRKGGINQSLPLILVISFILITLVAGPPPELASQ